VLTLMGIHYLDLNAISLAFHANLYNSLSKHNFLHLFNLISLVISPGNVGYIYIIYVLYSCTHFDALSSLDLFIYVLVTC